MCILKKGLGNSLMSVILTDIRISFHVDYYIFICIQSDMVAVLKVRPEY